MRLLIALCVVLLLVVLTGCTGSGGALPYDPANPPGDASTYSLPRQFDNQQGVKGWSFLRAATGGEEYIPLSWGAAPEGTPYGISTCWRDPTLPGMLIARDKLHPTVAQQAVIAWRVPKSGLIEITATFRALRADADGDGITLTCLQNATRFTEPITFANNPGQAQTTAAYRQMSAGDQLYLRLDAGADDTADWYGYEVQIVAR